MNCKIHFKVKSYPGRPGSSRKTWKAVSSAVVCPWCWSQALIGSNTLIRSILCLWDISLFSKDSKMCFFTWFYYHFWELYSFLYTLKIGPESIWGLFFYTMPDPYFHNYSLTFNLSWSLILPCLKILTDSLCWKDKVFGFILAFVLPMPTLDSLNSWSLGPGLHHPLSLLCPLL